MASSNVGFSLYTYPPNKAAPIVLAVLFALSASVHAFQARKHKSWKITSALPWGGLLFTAGFVMREVSAYHPDDLGIFIAQQVLLLVAPPVYSLTNYLLLSRLLAYLPHLSPLPPNRVITTFVGLDVVVEALTANGAAQVANFSSSPAQRAVGTALIRASLLLQVALFAAFMSLEAVLHRRSVRAGLAGPRVRALIALLYVSSALVLLRNVYRVVEVWYGPAGYPQTHEALFYVFDAALMLANSVMLNLWHPARYLPTGYKVYLTRDGAEVEGTGWVDERRWWATLLDPFDVAGLVRGLIKGRRGGVTSGKGGGGGGEGDDGEARGEAGGMRCEA